MSDECDHDWIPYRFDKTSDFGLTHSFHRLKEVYCHRCGTVEKVKP